MKTYRRLGARITYTSLEYNFIFLANNFLLHGSLRHFIQVTVKSKSLWRTTPVRAEVSFFYHIAWKKGCLCCPQQSIRLRKKWKVDADCYGQHGSSSQIFVLIFWFAVDMWTGKSDWLVEASQLSYQSLIDMRRHDTYMWNKKLFWIAAAIQSVR